MRQPRLCCLLALLYVLCQYCIAQTSADYDKELCKIVRITCAVATTTAYWKEEDSDGNFTNLNDTNHHLNVTNWKNLRDRTFRCSPSIDFKMNVSETLVMCNGSYLTISVKAETDPESFVTKFPKTESGSLLHFYIIIPLLLIAVLVVLGLTIYFYFRSKKKSETADSSTEPSCPTATTSTMAHCENADASANGNSPQVPSFRTLQKKDEENQAISSESADTDAPMASSEYSVPAIVLPPSVSRGHYSIPRTNPYSIPKRASQGQYDVPVVVQKGYSVPRMQPCLESYSDYRSNPAGTDCI